MYKLDLEKAEEPEIKLPTSMDYTKSKGIKYIYIYTSASLVMLKLLCGSQETVEYS